VLSDPEGFFRKEEKLKQAYSEKHVLLFTRAINNK